MRAFIDHVNHHLVRGWAFDDADPATPVSILVQVDGVTVARVLANMYREDLEQAGFGTGRHGFYVALANLSGLRAVTLRLLREIDGADLPGSPVVLAASLQFDAATRDRLAALVADTDDPAELAGRAAFLAQQADRLLQRRADRRAGRPDPWAPRQFRVRWSGAGVPPPPEPAPRALVIDETMPQAGRDAGSQAITSHMLSLRRLGYRVLLAPADMAGGEGVAQLEALGIECAHAPWCGSVEEVLRREAGSFAAVYLHRGVNARYLPLIRFHQPRAHVVFSVADLQHIRVARQAAVEERPELRDASGRIRQAELSAARFSDAVVTHSASEAAVLRRDLPGAAVHVVPWAVPPRPTGVPFARRSGMAFIGSYGHPPNLDAAWWLLHEVMPAVRALDPSITCQLVGSGMPDPLRAAAVPGIVATGHVADLRTVFDAVRLTVAPLTFGAGVKGKVLDSMAAGVPCACTPVAAEGLPVPPPLDALVADGAEALARVIVRLHGDPVLNAAAAAAGLRAVSEGYSEAQVDAGLRDALRLRAA